MDRSGWDERYAQEDGTWLPAPNVWVCEECTDLTPGRGLDLGAGQGRNAVWLAERGWVVTAVDFSAVGLSAARDLADVRQVDVEWILADLTDYVPPRRAYDLVLVIHVHLPPDLRARMLSGAAAALAPGGLLLAVGHDLTNLTDGHGGPRDPSLLYTPERIVEELPGLEIERAERMVRPSDADGTEVQAIDTIVRARRSPAPRRGS